MRNYPFKAILSRIIDTSVLTDSHLSKSKDKWLSAVKIR